MKIEWVVIMRVTDCKQRRRWPEQMSSRRLAGNAACLFLIGSTFWGCAPFKDLFSPAKVAAPAPRQNDPVPIPLSKPNRKATHTKDIQSSEVKPDQLIGLDMNAVQKILGSPSQTKNEDLSREWIYAPPSCSFSVFFYPALDGASFHALKYSSHGENGEDISETCIHRIRTGRKSAAD